jgi:hypothetical protein
MIAAQLFIMETLEKMYDIFYVSEHAPSEEYRKLKQRFPFTKLVASFDDARQQSLTDFFWVVWDDLIPLETFNFDYAPDEWSKNYIHLFLNSEHYDGISLIPKHAQITNKEIQHRFFINHKKVEIIASMPKPFDVFVIEDYSEYELAFETTTTEMFWMVSNNLTYDHQFVESFYISHHNRYDRNENHAFVHEANEQRLYNGIFLLSKNKKISKREVDYRFLISRKEWDTTASGPVQYDIFEITTYDDYLNAMKNSKTEMFWATHPSIQFVDDFEFLYFSHDNDYDRSENHAFIHKNGDQESYSGVFLFSKRRPVSNREITYRFLINAKQWDLVASEPKIYDSFYTKSYKDYLNALESTKTEMFWIIPPHVELPSTFDFKYFVDLKNEHSRTNTHVFLNGKYYDGVMLSTKHRPLTQHEYDYNFVANRIEVEHPKLQTTPKSFDIIFISYQEPNADENYKNLKSRFPHAKRVHGVKGIHQAHIEAAKLCETDMFWIVDGDAIVVDDFNFDYQVPKWEFDTVHVWRSVNPINDLVYGYGGIKLFPRKLTIEMDTSKPDMTTSISKKFKAMSYISNITGFNTDPFNTWKSAFRECCKLASRTIDRQKEDETSQRLATWCSVGTDKPYGKYALDGARLGSMYGTQNSNNTELLKKINDFEWLKEQFDARNL